MSINRPLKSLMVVWGIPGTGKSTFGRWLVRNKRFSQVDTDLIAVGRATHTDLTCAWQLLYSGSRGAGDVAQFMAVVSKHPTPVVLQYGLRADERGINLLRSFRDLGADCWWFDGDPDAARAAWWGERQRIDPKECLPKTAWDDSVAYIARNWQQLQDLIGRDRILHTIKPGPVFVPPEEIYATIQQVTAAE